MDGMQVGVDPRLELLMTVQSASAWYRQHLLARQPAPYRDACFALAARHAGHPALAMVDALLAERFAYDGPVALLLHHGAPPALAPLVPYAGPARHADFVAALRDFAATSDFTALQRRWRPFHAALEVQAAAVFDPGWWEHLVTYVGRPSPPGRLILAPLLPPQTGFGATVGGVAHQVAGPASTGADGEPRFDDGAYLQALVLHEGAHAFVNPLCEALAGELGRSGHLLAAIRVRLPAAYASWTTCVAEHVVRAVVLRLTGADEARVRAEEAAGFPYLRPVLEALAAYEAHRDAYPDLRAFGPQLVAVFDGLARQEA
jgi:hypothetical protein